MRIALVGCGFLGGIIAEELGKRLWAHDFFHDWVLVDGDAFEARNAGNQNCYPDQANTPKTTVAGDVLASYGQHVTERILRVAPGNIGDILKDVDLIIDAVDNVPTRQLLWGHGITKDIPVIHAGLTRSGAGAVEWTFNADQDTFSLSPVALAGKVVDAEAGATLKPCELLVHRRVGFMTAHTTAVAVCLALGLDPEEQFEAGEKSLVSYIIAEGDAGITVRVTERWVL